MMNPRLITAAAATAVTLLTCATAVAANVTYRDLTPADEALLKRDLPHLKDDPDMPALDDAIRLLMARGTYENIFVERDAGGNYAIIGKPLRIVEKVELHGVQNGSESELRDLLEFKTADRFERKKAVSAGERMKQYYGERGYFNTVIELNFEKAESKNIHLVFNIQERPPCLIRTLGIETVNTDLKELLESNFKNLRGKPLTTDRVQKMMRHLDELLIDNRYLATEVVGPDAKYNPEKTEAFMQIEVREPYRWEFYFEGNDAFSTVDVYHALDLKNRERRNVDPANEGAERLRRAYLERGYPNAQIETKVTNAPGSYLRRVYYKIAEGPRVKIKAIEVQGRVSRKSAYYQYFILANSSDLISDGYYNRVDLENGFKNLVTELRNQGFLHAKVLSSRIEYNELKNKVTVVLLLEEGSQTQVRGLDFVGNKFFSSFELAEVTGLETNSPLKLDKFETSLAKLKAFYHDQGFMEMKLLNEGEDLIQYNDKGTQARVVFQIYEGPRIRVHAIRVEGNVLTQTQVIMKETDFKLGEVLTPQKIEDATVRLNKMNLFSRVDIRTAEEGTSLSERTLLISVSEREPGMFTFGGGVTNERNLTVRGFTALSYNNLFGTARAISGRAEIRSNVAKLKYPESEITAGYLEPFLFNTRTRGRVNLTRSQYVFNYIPTINNQTVDVTEINIKNKVDFLIERDLTQHTKLTWKTWSIESRQDFERHGRCLPDPKNPNAPYDINGHCPATNMQVASIGPQVDVDYRDNPFLPTRGSFTRFGLDYSRPSLGSSRGVEFYKADGGFTYYQRMGSPRVVWANAIRGGYLRNLSTDAGSGVPTDWSFVLGGIYTIRGFDLSSPFNRVPKEGEGGNTKDHPTGFVLGTANDKFIKDTSEYYLIKSELRFPLYGDWGGVVFYDGGAVYISGYKFDRPYRDSVGFGVRYNTPVGPVAIDWAFKIRPENHEASNQVHFSIGTF